MIVFYIYFLKKGAFAGYLYWIVCYPFDLIKTKIQADEFLNPYYKSFRSCFK